MAQNILKKALKYKKVAESFTESEQHLRNSFMPKPQILKVRKKLYLNISP
jgi:hypothetical protein